MFMTRSNLWIHMVCGWIWRKYSPVFSFKSYDFAGIVPPNPEMIDETFPKYNKSNLPTSRSLATRRLTVLAGVAIILSTSATETAATDLPSGVTAKLHEVLVEQIGTENWTRFRFTAPQIDRTRLDAPAFADLQHDFPYLCTTLALPFLTAHDLDADKIVISIADRIFEFGVSDPDATQYFEQFRIENGACVWEAF